jgi:hypothetical protein
MPLLDANNNDNNNNNLINDNEYIKMFFVGLMDGDGSIQVNHWRKQSLQYRFIIKLNNIKSNFDMLVKIAKVIGGNVRLVNSNKEVIWVVDRKDTIIKILIIFDTYPPLTSRMQCQLAFLKTCLIDKSINNYFSNRELKYNNQLSIIKSFNSFMQVPDYFKSWLSGFIEAEGCFSNRQPKKISISTGSGSSTGTGTGTGTATATGTGKIIQSFSIGQNNDFYLINAIKLFFETSNKVRNPYKTFYSLDIYKKDILSNIIKHCISYPLLGEKALSLKKFIEVFNK